MLATPGEGRVLAEIEACEARRAQGATEHAKLIAEQATEAAERRLREETEARVRAEKELADLRATLAQK